MTDPMLSSPMIVGDPEILASILKEGVNLYKFRLKGEPKSKVEAEHLLASGIPFFIMMEYFCLASKIIEITVAKHQIFPNRLGLLRLKIFKYFKKSLKKFKDL